METNQISKINVIFIQKFLVLALFNFCCTTLFAQWPAAYKTRDSIVEKSIYNLQEKGVDTIAIYSQYSSPLLLPNCRSDQFPNYNPNKYDPCSSESTFLVFIIWKKGGQSFFTFRSHCYDYPTKLILDNGLWNYYVNNWAAIENSKPKEPMLKHVNLQTEEVTIGEEKTSYKERENDQFIIIMKNKRVTKNMGYRLYQRFGIYGDQNLNYDFNISLPDKQLQMKLDSLCKPLVISKELIIAVKN